MSEDATRLVLFAIDDEAFPVIRGVQLHMHRPEKHPANPIVARGTDGQPDAHRAQTPAVIRDGTRWRMWYSGFDATEPKQQLARACYAESDDGLAWRKPDLGLVDYDGDRHNNLVDAQPGFTTVAVIRDPDAPPERRYVMSGENKLWWHQNPEWSLDGPSMTRVEVSPDGLRWTPVNDEPGLITPQHEASTLYKFGGYYHLGGHQPSPMLRLPMQDAELGAQLSMLGPRTFVIWRSPVLDRWPVDYTLGFFKPQQSSSPYRRGWDREEVHLGAAVTPIGGVCLGVYGQYHHPIDDVVREGVTRPKIPATGFEYAGRPYPLAYSGEDVSIDLGLVISNDGLHFREPAPGFTLIERDQELRWDRDFRDNTDVASVLLIQGSIVTTPERTFIYYCATSPGGNVAGVTSNIGVATLPRDRFGSLQPIAGAPRGGFFTTRALDVKPDTALAANVDVPQGSSARLCLMDADGLDALPGYGFDDLAAPIESGLDAPIRWRGRQGLPMDRAFRVRVNLEGAARLYALTLD